MIETVTHFSPLLIPGPPRQKHLWRPYMLRSLLHSGRRHHWSPFLWHWKRTTHYWQHPPLQRKPATTWRWRWDGIRRGNVWWWGTSGTRGDGTRWGTRGNGTQWWNRDIHYYDNATSTCTVNKKNEWRRQIGLV